GGPTLQPSGAGARSSRVKHADMRARGPEREDVATGAAGATRVSAEPDFEGFHSRTRTDASNGSCIGPSAQGFATRPSGRATAGDVAALAGSHAAPASLESCRSSSMLNATDQYSRCSE